MRILFVFPFLDNMYHKMGFILPPLGIGYIASVLQNNGFDVDILDLNICDDKNPSNIPFSDYDVIAISSDTTKYYKSLEIAKIAKEKQKIIIFGGPHASFMDKELLETGYCDIVVRGEGEITMTEIMHCILENNNRIDKSKLKKIDGISFYDEGITVRTQNRAFIENLDSIPLPARSIMNMEKYKTLELHKRKITSIITSRGCPFDCSFCSSSRFTGLRWRTRSVNKIIDEVEDIVFNYDYNAIAFLDDNFTLNPNRAIDLSNEILKRKLDIYWWCFSRCDTIVKNEAMVEKMALSGCKYIFLGIENPSQEALDSINKGISAEITEKAVSILKNNNIETMASYIIGHPHDTDETIKNTVKYAKKLKTGGVQFSILTPFPGTRLMEEMENDIKDKNWEHYDCMHLVYKHKNFSAKELENKLQKAYLKNYLTFKRVIKGIFSTLIGKGIKISTIKKMIKNFKNKDNA